MARTSRHLVQGDRGVRSVVLGVRDCLPCLSVLPYQERTDRYGPAHRGEGTTEQEGSEHVGVGTSRGKCGDELQYSPLPRGLCQIRHADPGRIEQTRPEPEGDNTTGAEILPGGQEYLQVQGDPRVVCRVRGNGDEERT